MKLGTVPDYSVVAALSLMPLTAAAASDVAEYPAGEGMVMTTRAGRVEASIDGARPVRVLVSVDGRAVGQVDGVSRVGDIGIYDDDGGRIFALVEARADGAACQRRYLVVELFPGRVPRASPSFGTCAEVDRAVARRNGFVAWMAGRPDGRDLTADRRRERFETRYVWSRGRLTVTVARSRPWPPPPIGTGS